MKLIDINVCNLKPRLARMMLKLQLYHYSQNRVKLEYMHDAA